MTDQEWEELKRKRGVPPGEDMIPWDGTNARFGRAYFENMEKITSDPAFQASVARVKAALDPANIARAAKMLREQRAKDVAPEPDSSVSKDSKRRYRSIDDE